MTTKRVYRDKLGDEIQPCRLSKAQLDLLACLERCHTYVIVRGDVEVAVFTVDFIADHLALEAELKAAHAVIERADYVRQCVDEVRLTDQMQAGALHRACESYDMARKELSDGD